MGAEGETVAAALSAAYGLVVRSLGPAAAGTATRNYRADTDRGPLFVKTYPTGGPAERAREAEAEALARFAADAGVPVPPVLPTRAGDLLHRGAPPMSVWHYRGDAETAESGLRGDRWEAVGRALSRLHRAFALRCDTVAGIVDFRPPEPRAAAWEIARIGCDPCTVVAEAERLLRERLR